MVVGGSADSILMMEGEMDEVSEKDMLDAIKAAHEAIKKLCDFQNELREEMGKPKREFTPAQVDADLEAKVKGFAEAKITEIVNIGLGKEEYNEKIKEAKVATMEALEAAFADDEDATNKLTEAKKILGSIEKNELRNMILEKGRRIDGVHLLTSAIYGPKSDTFLEHMDLLYSQGVKLKLLFQRHLEQKETSSR